MIAFVNPTCNMRLPAWGGIGKGGNEERGQNRTGRMCGEGGKCGQGGTARVGGPTHDESFSPILKLKPETTTMLRPVH